MNVFIANASQIYERLGSDDDFGSRISKDFASKTIQLTSTNASLMQIVLPW